MAKLKNKDVMMINESLLYLSSLKTKAWYGVSRNMQKLKPVLKAISDNREAVTEELAEKDENGKIVFEGEGNARVPKFGDKKEEADKLWKEFMEEDAKKIDFYKIKLEKLEDTELDAMLVEPLLDTILVEE